MALQITRNNEAKVSRKMQINAPRKRVKPLDTSANCLSRKHPKANTSKLIEAVITCAAIQKGPQNSEVQGFEVYLKSIVILALILKYVSNKSV
mmetsp:Transcript_7236/g.11453  ORF Transcript_7236/g.11453 Transcript_7236/m.11453 type:complete len:93 (+) Transcript_7236:86-364(+)